MTDFHTLLELMYAGEYQLFKESFEKDPARWIDLCDEEGWNLLHHAAEYGDIEIIRFLLDAGVNPNHKSHSGYYPFYITIETGTYTPEIAELFISRQAYVGSDLHKAILTQDTEKCKSLISASFDLECTDEFGNHPLHNAVVTGNKTIAKLLLDNGANVNCQDISQTTPLHAICADKTAELLPLILEYKPDAEIRDYNGRTAIIFAAGNAFPEGVNQLLSYGIDINIQDHFGNTALHYAFENSEIEIAQILINAGADVHLINEDGLQPFDLFPGEITE
ncbi:MAG: ankyrin repeat domain-containing protein [Bacteroidales bacterium]